MSEAILKKIHDTYDVYDRYPYTDHSMISSVNISSHPAGYVVTTYPGGLGTAFDGLRINVRARDGIFGSQLPHRVETSRDGGLMTISVENISNDGIMSGMIQGDPVKREGLALPDDPGFELFEELHEQLSNIKPEVAAVAGMCGLSQDPTIFNYRVSGGSVSFDHQRGVATHSRFDTYQIGSNQANSRPVSVILDATVQTAINKRPSQEVVYRKGRVHQGADGRGVRLAEPEELIAFAGLNASIRKLYS